MKKPRYQVMRLFRRRLSEFDRWELASLRDELWDRQITAAFKSGDSVEYLVNNQPNRASAQSVEAAIRRRMKANA